MKKTETKQPLLGRYCSVSALIFFQISTLKTVFICSGATVSQIEKAYAKRKNAPMHSVTKLCKYKIKAFVV
ncbi:MAG: hypothetical protein K2K80_08080 [Clostridia bacterium]|nr:hypothetical protein [Clostridia bacterium]